MSCAVFTILGVYVALAEKKSPWIVAASAILAIVFFVIASYRTWKRQYILATGFQERVNNLEKAVFNSRPIIIPSTMRVQHQNLSNDRYGYTIEVLIFGLPIGASEIDIVFTWPIVNVLASITHAKFPGTVEASGNSQGVRWEQNGPYGCKIPLTTLTIIEKSFLVLYVTSSQPCSVVSVKALY